ncbi:MAG: dienelactone hydrolase family protein, partial [Myxococcota bacterium]
RRVARSRGRRRARQCAAKVPATIEVYEDAMHGWVPTDSRAHHPRQAERAWAQMLKLFEAQLGSIRP